MAVPRAGMYQKRIDRGQLKHEAAYRFDAV